MNEMPFFLLVRRFLFLALPVPILLVTFTACVGSTPLSITATATFPVPTPTRTASQDPALLTLPAPAASLTPAMPDWQPAFPIRAAFYYPWFPEAWTQQGFSPFTNYTPQHGYYNSSDQEILKQHIANMLYGNIQAGIASWWGQGTETDQRFPELLAAASGTRFRWAVYYEAEGQGDPTVGQIQDDLTYLLSHYGNDPGYLKVNGRPVVFVYSDPNDNCGMAMRWKQADTMGAYLVLKTFPRYRKCTSQPDSWHQYAPAIAANSLAGYSFTISPGFWKKGEGTRLGRDLKRWSEDIKAMLASRANWQLITTFNEWGEGTAVEPAVQWASVSGEGQYLDALHTNGN